MKLKAKSELNCSASGASCILAERLDLTILELQIQPPYFGDS